MSAAPVARPEDEFLHIERNEMSTVDFLFFGRHIRVLLMVVIGTSMMHAMVMKENHQENVNRLVQGLVEIGATGQQIEWVGSGRGLSSFDPRCK